MALQFPDIQDKTALETGETLAPRFNADGLITAIAQDFADGTILMLAHMNAEALSKTIETGKAYYWSRSRSELWLKGETSGNIQTVHEILIDCDQDAVILKVTPAGGAACHTGRVSCFYRKINPDTSLSEINKEA